MRIAKILCMLWLLLTVSIVLPGCASQVVGVHPPDPSLMQTPKRVAKLPHGVDLVDAYGALAVHDGAVTDRLIGLQKYQRKLQRKSP